jgi:hypothetical protein
LAESKEFTRTADNEQRLSVTHQLTFNGYLLPTNPALSGVPDETSCLQLLDRKSDQLCSALEDYGDLLIVDGSGYVVISETPRIASLSFDESQIVNHRTYSVTFEFEKDFGNDKIRDYNENWSYEQQDDDTVSVSHDISAVGVSNSGVGSSIANARSFVLSKVAGASPDKTQAFLIRQPFVQSIVDVDNLTPFNHVLTESSDITGGSYNATETWVLASGNFQDDRGVDHTFELREDNVLVETVTINGTVQGYGDTTFDRFSAALGGWNSSIKTEIGFDASGISSKNYTENRFAGTITYSLSRAVSDDPDELIESKTISRTFERQEDGSTLQTVTTSAGIRTGSSGTIGQVIEFCFANNFPITSAEPQFDISLSGNVISKSTQRDELAKTFSLTRSYVDQTTALYTEEYSVSRDKSVDTSQLTISIQGTVQGLGEESTTKSQDRFARASGAFYGTVEPLIFARASQIIPTGDCVLAESVTDSFGFTPFNGTITYARTYASRAPINNSDIVSEQIEIGFTNQSQVIAEIQVPGKLDGPILQDQQTQTGKEKTLSITYVMAGGGASCSAAVADTNALLVIAFAESEVLVTNTPTAHSRGEKPESSKVFKTGDTHNFNRQTLQFTRNVTWKYL